MITRVRQESGSVVIEAVEDDRVVGEIVLVPRGAFAQVKFVEVDRKRRGRGIGTALYEAAARLACARWGVPLASDESRSRYSAGFWRKQEAAGRARRVEHGDADYYITTCPPPATFGGLARRFSL